MTSVLGRRVRCEITSSGLLSDSVVKRKESLQLEPIEKHSRIYDVIWKSPSPVYKYKTCCITDAYHDCWRIPLGHLRWPYKLLRGGGKNIPVGDCLEGHTVHPKVFIVERRHGMSSNMLDSVPGVSPLTPSTIPVYEVS